MTKPSLSVSRRLSIQRQEQLSSRRLFVAKDDSPIGQVWLFYSNEPPVMDLGTYDTEMPGLCDRIQIYDDHPLACLVLPGECFEVEVHKR